ncbi:hypothetical protein BU15DRAFT_73631 [Melanogaster broomeanus]|nr:hypothetical protein BU15DRAFT_73631 [Melanogaster broomeanus]
MKTKRKQPVFAEEWQLAILRKLQTESRRPTEEQRLAAVAETGLDEIWVKNWFVRQKSKVAAQNRKSHALLQQENVRAQSAHLTVLPVTTFRLQSFDLPAANEPRQAWYGHPSSTGRSVSEAIEPACVPGPSGAQVSRTSATHRSDSPHLYQSVVGGHAISRYEPRFSSTSMPYNDSFPIRTVAAQTVMLPTYSRDPLYNRYPDFSQFFHPQVYERFRSSELLPPINGHDHLVALLANTDMDTHAPAHLRGQFISHHFNGVSVVQDPSTGLQGSP